MSSRQSGLSLIELMIVVSIVGILSAFATQRYQTYILKTKCSSSILRGDLNGDYDLSTAEITASINVLLTPNAGIVDYDDEIGRRKLLWFDHNGDNLVNNFDISPLAASLPYSPSYAISGVNGGNECYDNNFKSNFNQNRPNVDPTTIKKWGE